jgi:hypothetical protein
VPGIDLAHLIGTRRLIRAQRGADVAHEGDGRAGRGPDSEHPGTSAVRVTEGVPLPAGGDEHRPGGRFLRLIERVVRVRDRPGEMSRDGHLHGREPSGPVLITGKDGHRLPRIPQRRGISAMSKERPEPFYPPAGSKTNSTRSIRTCLRPGTRSATATPHAVPSSGSPTMRQPATRPLTVS